MIFVFFYIVLSTILNGDEEVGTVQLHNSSCLRRAKNERLINIYDYKGGLDIQNNMYDEIITLESSEDNKAKFVIDQNVKSRFCLHCEKYKTFYIIGLFCLSMVCVIAGFVGTIFFIRIK